MGAAGKASPSDRLPLLPHYGERRAEKEKPIVNLNGCSDRTLHLAAALATLAVLGTIACLVCSIPPCAELEYSVAITGTDGLNATDLLRPATLSPAFDLAFRVRKREQDECGWHACIGGPDKKLAVSYSGVLLADRVAPLLPKICSSPERPEPELNATAWSVDVALPRFLRERLAAELERGEAVFDVEYDPPSSALACKARIGQGLCPCTYETGY